MILYNIFIYPIELLVEFFFVFFYESFENVGISIIGISVVINMLALPLYHTAELLQRKEREVRLNLAPGVQRIKQAFTGDEQYMLLTTFYRQRSYHPVYALRSSLSLLIQVPFFIAAYHFLSHVPQLQGESFLGIPDLGKPDGLLSLGSFPVHLLPLLMTLINVIAGAIYTKGLPLRDKLQLYAMALLFLVLLYGSPSGLVLYWTLNNLFSLVKNIFYKLRNPLKLLYILTSLAAVATATVILILHPWAPLVKRLLVIFAALGICAIPWLLRLFNHVYEEYLAEVFTNTRQRNTLFFISCVLLLVVQGFVVPSLLITSSPTEFSYIGEVEHPLSFICDTATRYVGLYLVWIMLLFSLGNRKLKDILALVFPCLAIIALGNLFLFPGEYGHISSVLLLENPGLLNPSWVTAMASLAMALFVFIGCFLLCMKGMLKFLQTILILFVMATTFTSAVSCFSIHQEFTTHKELLSSLEEQSARSGGKADYQLSKTGKNVIFLFLDRAISSYADIFFQEFPEMKSVYSGFTYYPNTVSYGTNTANGSPAMLAGYEYTPEHLNARANEKMVDKHNEALLVLPRIFSEAGYAVTVSDPPYSNYRLVGDYRPFSPYPDIAVKQLMGKYAVRYKQEHAEFLQWDDEATSNLVKTRLPVFSLLRTAPPIAREAIYDKGRYLLMADSSQHLDDFLASYSQLYYLHDVTDYSADGDTFTMISNETAHEPVLLEPPCYEPRDTVAKVHNPLTEYLETTNLGDITTYHVNAATLLQLARWIQRLKDEGVYDSTRIIIVSDHGHPVHTTFFQDFKKNALRYALFNPLLLAKDFDAEGPLQEDDRFMTNADAAIMALSDLDIPMVNPFTEEQMESWIEKDVVSVFQGGGANFTGNQIEIDPHLSYTIYDDIRVEEHWGPYNE